MESKAFPGGPEGVEALSRSVDIGRTLVLLNADVASLRDPKCLPISAEAQAKVKPKRGDSSSAAGGAGRWCGCGDGKAGGEGGPRDEGVAEGMPTPAPSVTKSGTLSADP